MRSQIHDATFKFRVNEGLLAGAQLRAANRGMSLSELVRDALRREVEGRA